MGAPPPQPSRALARTFSTLFLLNLAAVVLLWWLGSGARTQPRLADELNAAARVTGLVGTYLALVQLVLRTHVPLLVRAYGKDRLKSAHTSNAYLALGLLAIHAVLQTIGYAVDDGKDLLGELANLIAHYDGLLAAVVSFAALAVLTLISVDALRHHFPWTLWRGLHLTTYIAVALAVPHELATGADFIDAPVAVAYWWLLLALVSAAIVVSRGPLLWTSFRRSGLSPVMLPTVGAAALAIYLVAAVRITPIQYTDTVAASPAPSGRTPSPTPGAAASAAAAPSPAASRAPGGIKDGTYLGDMHGTPYGAAQVEITVSGGRLTAVSWALMPRSTTTSINRSIAMLPILEARSIKAQSAKIDVLSGATYTGDAYKESLAEALRKAGFPE